MLPLVFEKALTRKGFKSVAGVDEVGRGPLAGPIVAAAVILPLDCSIPGLNDSKKLSPRKRKAIFSLIKKQAVAIAVARVGHREIDRINIGRANLRVLEVAAAKLKIRPDFVLIDGERNRLKLPTESRCLKGGDGRCASIAAASIIAKVTRDRWMEKCDKKYPGYGFAKHKGYGTREHLGALAKLGPCVIHRRSFL